MNAALLLLTQYGGGGNLEPVLAAGTFGGSIPNLTASISDVESSGFSVGTPAVSESVTWTIQSGNEAGKFAINSSSGELTLAARVDSYEDAEYVLVIRGTDPGGLYSEATITASIVIGDVDLLFDGFMASEGPPLASPRACDIGTLILVQTDGQFSISVEQLNFPAQTTPVYGDQGFRDDTIRTRAAGQMLQALVRFSTAANNNYYFWGAGATVHYNQIIGSAWAADGNAWSLLAADGNGAVIGVARAVDTDYLPAVIQRPVGNYLFMGADLEFVIPFGTGNAAAGMGNHNSAGTIEYLIERQLAGHWLDDNLYLLNQVTPVSTTVYDTVSANDLAPGSAFILLRYTLPSTTVGRVLELKFNYQDANNYWVARVERNAGDTDWDFEVDSVAAGVPTNRITVTSIGANGEIAIKTNGSLRNFYCNAQGSIANKRGSEVNVSHLNTETEVSVVTTGTGWTLTSLQVWARSSVLYGRIFS